MKANSFRPMPGKVFVSDMDEGMHKTAGGIILTDDMGKDWGIRPRWGKVAMVADNIDFLTVGEWVLIEHGRWTKRMPLELADQPSVDYWMIDTDAILVVSDKNESNERITL